MGASPSFLAGSPASAGEPRLARRHGLGVAVAAACLVALLPATGAGADAPSARGYATALFSRVPLPSGARRLAAPVAALAPVGSPTFSHAVVDLTRYYVLPASFGVDAYVRSHFPRDEWGATSSTSDGGYRTSSVVTALSLCPDRRAAYCGVTYSAEGLSGGRQELRVDVAVVWLPTPVVRLPEGTVTVTGFDRISLMNASSGPVTRVLTAAQAAALRADVAALRAAPGAMCMEDSLLYRIAVTAGGRVIWSGTGDECPGVLLVTSSAHRVELNDRSCALDALITSFFPNGEAAGSKTGLKVCQSSF